MERQSTDLTEGNADATAGLPDENEAVTGSHPSAFPVTERTRKVALGREGREGREQRDDARTGDG